MRSLQEITDYILGKLMFTQIDSNDYVDWAIQVLDKGIDNENIRILAGLDCSDTDERQKYFQKALLDLNIQIPTNKNLFLDDFSRSLANNVIAGFESPKVGLKIMLDIVRSSDYSPRFIRFMDLDEDINYVLSSSNPVLYLDLNKNNIDEMILNEFKLFIQESPLDQNI